MCIYMFHRYICLPISKFVTQKLWPQGYDMDTQTHKENS